MNDEQVPRWVAELSDNGRMSQSPSDPGEAHAAQRLTQLMQAFGRVLKPAQQSASDSAQAFTWGHLRATALIGRGGFGDVYRAFDTTLEREVALKLRHGEAAHARAFIAEARRLAQVRHPNVLAVYGAGVHDGRAGLWADLLDGHTVSDTVGAHGALSWLSILALARDLANALAAVHRAGLIHGDVKPSNVMLQADGRAVLMDFGAAAEHATAARFGVLGSPLSMAPEQLQGEPVDTAADMYSLGVVIYFAACGRHPVQAATRAGLQSAHKEFDPARALRGQTQLPRAFRRLLAAWLDPDPTQRPDERISLREIERIATAPTRRRKRFAVSAVIGSLVLALLVSLFALTRINAERRAAQTARNQQAAVSEFLENTLAAPSPANDGADVRIAEVLGVAAENAQREFAEQPAILLPLMRTIGNSYAGLGLNHKAEPLLQRALNLSNTVHGPDAATTLAQALQLGHTHVELNPDDDTPLQTFESVFSRAEAQLGRNHQVTVQAAVLLADWHQGRGNLAAAQPYVDFVLAQRPVGSTRQTQRISALIVQANIDTLHGDTAAWESHMEQALQLTLVHEGELSQHAYVLRGGLAAAAMQHGDILAAEQYLRSTLDAAGRFGESHALVRETLTRLGALLYRQHKYAEAEAKLRRAIELAVRYGPYNGPVLHRARTNLANLLAETGNLSAAGRLREQLRSDAVERFGANAAVAILTTLKLAEQRLLEGKATAALGLAEDASKRAAQPLHRHHGFIAMDAAELVARAQFLQGKRSAALAAMADVCAQKRNVLGNEHRFTLVCMSHRADMLAAAGRRDEAISVIQQVLKLTEQQFGEDHPDSAGARAHLHKLENGRSG